MDSAGVSMNDLEEACAGITLEHEISGGLIFDGEDSADVLDSEPTWPLVGKLLSDKVYNFEALKQTIASVWRPLMGMEIQELGPNKYLFKFFHELDVEKVLKQGPWSFERNLLLVGRVAPGVSPWAVDLFTTEFWVQVYDLPSGLWAEKVSVVIGNQIGKFVEADPNNFGGTWKSYMRIKVSLDIRNPIPRKVRIKKSGGEWGWISFKYERLPTFCFYCGIMGHTDLSCEQFFQCKDRSVPKPYGAFLRAPAKKGIKPVGEKWLGRKVIGSSSSTSGGERGAMAVDAGLGGSNVAVPVVSGLAVGSSGGSIMSVDGIPGKETVNLTANMGKSVEEEGLIVLDSKRRRGEGPNQVMLGGDVQPKNVVGAGSGDQTRPGQ